MKIKLLGITLGLVLATPLALFLLSKVQVAKATVQEVTNNEWSACIPDKECGTETGTQTRTDTVDRSFRTICPDGYHLQNDGELGQRCHRNHGCGWYHEHQLNCPVEHVLPTKIFLDCEEGFKVAEDESKCTMTETRVCEVQFVPCPTDTPTASPSATPEPTEEPKNPNDSLAPGEAPSDPTCQTLTVTPTILSFERLNPTSVKVTWSLTDPITNYWVFFGLSADKLDWNVKVENSHEVTLSDLPANQSIWISVAETDQGCIGNHSVVVDP